MNRLIQKAMVLREKHMTWYIAGVIDTFIVAGVILWVMS